MTGVPVLLLHGLSQQRHFWSPVVRRMRARPVAALDQRAHGDTDTPLGVDVSIGACADDVVALMDRLGWDAAVVVGHSWGAAVALAVAARHPERVRMAVLIDGGLLSPARLGDRAQVRERLTPPALGITEDALWSGIIGGSLAATWSEETRAALAPTFVTDADGRVRTRIGVDRHLAVLDGLLDHDPEAALSDVAAAGVPVWAIVCEAPGAAAAAPEWTAARDRAIDVAASVGNCRIHRWSGAVHDVPLQWPALVAGLIDTAAETTEGGQR